MKLRRLFDGGPAQLLSRLFDGAKRASLRLICRLLALADSLMRFERQALYNP
jgi:hypothetical protein